MAVTVDKVIVELEAKLDRYNANLANADRNFTRATGSMQTRIKQLETEMRSSTSRMALSFKSVAGALAGAFSVREISRLLDSYTRFTNQLAVAGFEGEKFAQVQNDLFGIAQKYGTQLEAVGTLFGRNAASAQELNLAYEDQLTLVKATSAALKVNGTDAQAAAGGLLQLSQLLGGNKVQSQEFNSLIDSMRPLLQGVAAGSDKWGGSVAKLTQDVKAGNVEVKEFVDALLKGAPQVIEKAEKATLTLSGSVETLKNSLVKYLGEADKANGLTEAMSTAISALADNLDIIIPALATVAALMGLNLAQGLALSAVNAVATSNAVFALTARMAGAATTAEALGFALIGLKSAGITLGIAALAAGIYLVSQRMGEAEEATGRYKRAIDQSNKSMESATKAADALARARGEERKAALAAAEAEKIKRQETLKAAQADVFAAEAALRKAYARAQDERQAAAAESARLGDPRGFGFGLIEPSHREQQAEKNVRAAQEAVTNEYRALKKIDDAIKAPPSVGGGGGGDGDASKPKKTGGKADIVARFNREIESLSDQALSAMISQASSADERAELELRRVETARLSLRREINADADYDATQKSRLFNAIELVAFEERAAIEKQRQAENEADLADLAQTQADINRDLLKDEYDRATSQARRKDIALALVDAEYDELKLANERIASSEVATKFEKERAALILQNIEALRANARERAVRDNLTPGEQYVRDLIDEAESLDDAYQRVAVNGLRRVNSELSETVKQALGLHGVLGDIIGDFIEIAIRQALLKPIADLLWPGSGGGGGGIFGSIFGVLGLGGLGKTDRSFGINPSFAASGKNVEAGRPVVVGENGQEVFVPPVSGRIIPNGRLNGAMGGSSMAYVQIEVAGSELFDVRVARVSQGVSTQVVASAAPTLIETAAAETTRRLTRDRI